MLMSAILFFLLASPQNARATCQSCTPVEQAIKTAQRIRPGLTRAEIEKIYQTDGGISSLPISRYRDPNCESIKVDVTYQLAWSGTTSDGDIVLSVSKPYLEPAYYD
jgi:hypothetical protein